MDALVAYLQILGHLTDAAHKPVADGREVIMDHRTRYAGVVLQVVRTVLPDRARDHRPRLCLLAIEQEAVRSRREVDPAQMRTGHGGRRTRHHTGYLTTGHEWNGIKELNTPVPRAVYFFLIVAFVFSLGYWVLMPAWPLGVTYTKGLLGIDQRNIVQDSLKQAALDRSAWTQADRGRKLSATIQADPALMNDRAPDRPHPVRRQLRRVPWFNAKGGQGFPNLTTTSWLWGGDPESIAETIRVGINSPHPTPARRRCRPSGATRCCSRPTSTMWWPTSSRCPIRRRARRQSPATSRPARRSSPPIAPPVTATTARASSDMGAPNLTDKFWIYGGDAQSIDEHLWSGRQGHMPSWEGRLTPLDRKILTLYLLDLRRPTP